MSGAKKELGDQLVVEVFVADLSRSLHIYTALGFELERRDEHFAALRFKGLEFFLDERPELPPAGSAPRANVRILTSDVDAKWILARQLGLRVSQPIADRYYGLRDFTVLDPDGFGLRFAGPIASPHKNFCRSSTTVRTILEPSAGSFKDRPSVHSILSH